MTDRNGARRVTRRRDAKPTGVAGALVPGALVLARGQSARLAGKISIAFRFHHIPGSPAALALVRRSADLAGTGA
jgi:hypothetical protein